MLIPVYIACFGLFGAVLVLILPNNLFKLYKIVSITISSLMFFWSLLLWLNFNKLSASFQFLINIAGLQIFNVNLIFGVDGLSLTLIILTTFIIIICILGTYQIDYKNQMLNVNLLSITSLLILTFSAIDLFLFILFFEILLLFIFYIIFIWGARVRRLVAIQYLFMYTIFGSVFLISALIILYSEAQSLEYIVLINLIILPKKELIVWLFLFLSFIVKIPVIPFHLWLPEAHVEAPSIGSVILAGLLLKLGGYGVVRVLFWFEYSFIFFRTFIILICLISIIYSSIIALAQVDIKRIIAYSSIAHINFALLGLFILNIYGLVGGVLLFVSHGVVSSALFLLIGIIYSRYHTRNILYYSGLANTMPVFATILFIFIFSNFSFPGTSNFIGELLVIISLGYYTNLSLLILSVFTTFFTTAYSLIVFNRLVFGTINYLNFSIYLDITRFEVTILLPWIIINFWVGVYPITIISIIYAPLLNLSFYS